MVSVRQNRQECLHKNSGDLKEETRLNYDHRINSSDTPDLLVKQTKPLIVYN